MLVIGVLIYYIINSTSYQQSTDTWKPEESQETYSTISEMEESLSIKATTVETKKYGTMNKETLPSFDTNQIIDEPIFVPYSVSLSTDIQEYIYYLSDTYNINYSFVLALIETESKFNPNSISATNDYGLMQINACHKDWLAKNLNITNLLDPYQNTKAGLYMLNGLFEKYNDPSKVLMAYHSGEHGASVLWKKGITQTSYTNKILNRAAEFDKLYKKGA
jgi:soluble lytic murein transglycosylase-like protein